MSKEQIFTTYKITLFDKLNEVESRFDKLNIIENTYKTFLSQLKVMLKCGSLSNDEYSWVTDKMISHNIIERSMLGF